MEEVFCKKREDIPSKILQTPTIGDIECLIVELNLYKKKCLILGTFHPNKCLISNHLAILSKIIDQNLTSYDNIIILGDFNSEMCEDAMVDFCGIYNFKNIVNKPTCYKNPNNPSCIDLILTNRQKSFQDTRVIETGSSDFHMTTSVLKTWFKKQPSKVISYRDYKNYSQVKFRISLDQSLLGNDSISITNDQLVDIFMTIFNNHTPFKMKYARANDAQFMTKDLRKAIMKRSKLRNKFNKISSHFFLKKQPLRKVSLLSIIKIYTVTMRK